MFNEAGNKRDVVNFKNSRIKEDNAGLFPEDLGHPYQHNSDHETIDLLFKNNAHKAEPRKEQPSVISTSSVSDVNIVVQNKNFKHVHYFSFPISARCEFSFYSTSSRSKRRIAVKAKRLLERDR